MKLEDVILRNDRASQPAAADVPAGTIYYVTDEELLERSSGSAWEAISVDAAALIASIDSITLANTGLHILDTNASHDLIISPGSNLTADKTLLLVTGDSDRTITMSGDATLTASNHKKVIGVTFDGGGASPVATTVRYVRVPWACTITKWTILSDISGAAVVDVWKDTYANYPPTVADTIAAAAKPTLSAAVKNEDATLTGWTTSVAAGDVIAFHVDSASTVTVVTVELEVSLT